MWELGPVAVVRRDAQGVSWTRRSDGCRDVGLRMIDPLDDVRAFVSAALLTVVPRDHRESVQAVPRRRWAVAVTLVIGTVTIAWVSGPLHVGRA